MDRIGHVANTTTVAKFIEQSDQPASEDDISLIHSDVHMLINTESGGVGNSDTACFEAFLEYRNCLAMESSE